MNLYGKHTEETAERIVKAFRHSEQLPKALAPIFIRRADAVPCRKWSFCNQLLIALNGTSDARGMRQWNDVGRHVKKGSTALWILAPCLRTITDEDEHGERRERQVLTGFRSIPVFAVEDTEGNPLPEPDTSRQWVEQLPLHAVAESWGIGVDTYDGASTPALGYYRYSDANDGRIMLGVENLSTWAHELVHAADHKTNGLAGARWMQEVVAELGSAVLLECLGHHHEADLGGAYQYIAAYAGQAHKDVVRACLDVLNRVCACVKLILDTAEHLKAAPVPA